MSSAVPEKILKQAQDCIARVPAIIVGSGASLSNGIPGMEALKAHLLDKVMPKDSAEEDSWLLVRTSLASGDDIETALTKNNLPESLTSKIIDATWDLVAGADVEHFEKVVLDPRNLFLTKLFDLLFRSTHREINVVTTNYDRLIEYAADAGEYVHSTGFSPGYFRTREKGEASKVFRGGQQVRTVRIWKVHGSLDWFLLPDGTIIAAPFLAARPSQLTPVIVTPGIEKNQKTHEEPFRTIMAGADVALENSTGYLCIGFGFRDRHIEPKLAERCRTTDVPIVVLAKNLTTQAKTFLVDQKCQKFLALEETPGGTRAITSEEPNGIEIPIKNLWSLEGFLKLVS